MSSHLRGTKLSLLGLGVVLSGGLPFAALAELEAGGSDAALTTPNGRHVLNLRNLSVADSKTILRTWQELDEFGDVVDYYAISKDGGQTWSRSRETSYKLTLRYATFDPLRSVPAVHPALQAGESNRLHLVQFVTQPLDEFRGAIASLGGKIRSFAGAHTYIVEMDSEVRDAVENLPYVRWVGAHHPAYKTQEWILNEYFPIGYGAAEFGVGLNGADNPELGPQNLLAKDNGEGVGDVNMDDPVLTFNVMVYERGLGQKSVVAQRVREIGGTVDNLPEGGFLLRASINVSQIGSLLEMNEVAFMDIWGPPEDDMNIAREIGGADFIESTLGYTGEGVNVEVMDGNIRASHVDFQNPTLTFHGTRGGSEYHGTATSGIVYGDGTGNANGRGMLPDAAKKIFASYSYLTDRHAHTARLTDPNGQYRAVLQSNSWGSPREFDYTTVSADMDDLLLINDIIICQSQSNAGNQDSRPQAWAKNIVSVGGLNHYNTLTKDDDCWCGTASIGPASDGRIKPDFTHFYDNIYTTDYGCNTCYTSSFGGTSGATPIVAGHFGLLFQMWHEEVFDGFGGDATVFDSKPHAATAKAIMINSAMQYEFSGAGHDHSRVKQGWGMPDLETLYNNRNEMLIVDESDVLTELDSTEYIYSVPEGRAELKVTMVYADWMGNPANQGQHRVNDLTLKVTDPNGVEYWGNYGLEDGNYSVPGGSADAYNTVENVFVGSPVGGNWTIEVIADEINQDTHSETGATDADYALVASVSQNLAPSCLDLFVENLVGGQTATFTVQSDNIQRGDQVAILWSTTPGERVYNNVAGYCSTFDFFVPTNGYSRVVAQGFVDQNDEFVALKNIPGNLSGLDIMFQATQRYTCPTECMSGVWSGQIQ